MPNLDLAFQFENGLIFSETSVAIFSSTEDPTTGASASVGSLFLRSSGDAYLKTGVLDTDWTRVLKNGEVVINTVQPAAGLTITGGPINNSGTLTFALANDLAAIEALSGTGIAVRTTADTWATRTITGTTEQIAVTNGDGASGNPTISIANNPVLPGSAGVKLPSGSTSARSGSPQAGETRFNEETDNLEVFNGTHWVFFKDSYVMAQEKEPTGFVNRTDSVISFDELTRTFSIAPTGTSYDVFCSGVRFTKTATESIQIPDVTGPSYIVFNPNGELEIVPSLAFGLNAFASYIYWNADISKQIVFADERHGITMDGDTHSYLHSTFGTQYASGFEISNFTTTGDGSAESDLQVGISSGVLFDEDIRIAINHSASPSQRWEQVLTPVLNCEKLYKIGPTGGWRKNSTSAYPAVFGTSRLVFNRFNGTEWELADASADGKFVAVIIVSTNDIESPVVSFIGQHENDTLEEARNNNISLENFDLTGFPFQEFKPLYRLIYETDSTFTNSLKGRLVDVTDLRDKSFKITTAAVDVDHSSLSGLGNDDHPQYVHEDIARTISATHTFNPSLPGTPFIIGANASGQIVTGLNADLLDGLNASAFQPVDSDLTALSNTITNGIYVRTGSGTSATRSITGTIGHVDVSNGDGVAGNPTISLPSVGTAGTYGSATQVPVITTDAQGRVTSAVSTAISLSLGSLNDVTLTSPAASQVLTYNGTAWVNTTLSNGTVTSVATTAPAAGLTISGSPITANGTLVFALANDLAAVEGLTGTGIAVRTGADSWANRTITAGTGISVTNGSGAAGNPTITNTGAVSVFGRTGAVTAQEGDYSIDQLSDVAVNTPTSGQVLSFNGTSWVNALLQTNPILQMATGSFANISFNNQIPYDNTPPSVTEGAQVFSVPFTPLRDDTGIIVIASSFFTVASSNNVWVTGAIFNGTTLVEANLLGSTTDTGFGNNFTLIGGIISGSTTTRNISFRMGPNTNVTVHVGQGVGGQAYGGNNVNSHYIIMEVIL